MTISLVRIYTHIFMYNGESKIEKVILNNTSLTLLLYSGVKIVENKETNVEKRRKSNTKLQEKTIKKFHVVSSYFVDERLTLTIPSKLSKS